MCRQQGLPLRGGTARSGCKRIRSVRYAAANAYAADANTYAASATRRHGTQRQRTLLQPNPPPPPDHITFCRRLPLSRLYEGFMRAL